MPEPWKTLWISLWNEQTERVRWPPQDSWNTNIVPKSFQFLEFFTVSDFSWPRLQQGDSNCTGPLLDVTLVPWCISCFGYWTPRCRWSRPDSCSLSVVHWFWACGNTFPKHIPVGPSWEQDSSIAWWITLLACFQVLTSLVKDFTHGSPDHIKETLVSFLSSISKVGLERFLMNLSLHYDTDLVLDVLFI